MNFRLHVYGQIYSYSSQREEEEELGKKAKESRKGKNAWRENISAEEIEDYFGKSSKDALSGGSLSQFLSESLFYIDKSKV